MSLRTFAAAVVVALFLLVPSVSLAADCSALTSQLATLQQKASVATGLQLQILNLQIQLTLLQIQECNETAPPTDNGQKGKLVAYLNGAFYYSSDSITRTEALANCKQNGETVPVTVESYYCTWNGEEIYRKGSSEKGGLVAEVSSENPLKVTATYVMNEKKSCNGGTYGIYFGDENLRRGQEPQLLHFPADACNSYVQHTEHTYKKEGTYTIALYDLSGKTKVLLGEYTIAVAKPGKYSVTFDKGPYASATPTLVGKAKGLVTLAFGISVDNGDKIYGSGPNAIKPKGGKWSHTITTPLADGTYNVQAYGLLNRMLGSGTFTVRTASSTSGAPSIALISASRLEVTARYSVPAGRSAEVTVVNKDTGMVIAVYDVRQGGSGTAVMKLNASGVSTGLYYLELAYGEKPWLRSSTFTLEGTAPVCKVSVESLKGQGTLLTWTSTGATSATSDLDYAAGGTYGAVPVNGSRVVSPSTNSVYSFWFVGPGGRATCASSTVYPSTSNPQGGVSASIDQSSLVTTSRNPVITGSAQGAVSVLISVDGNLGSSFVKEGRWSYTATDMVPGSYAVQVLNRSDKSVLASGQLTVSPVILREPTPICSVSATPSVVAPKQAVTVSWSSKYASHVTGPFGDKVDANGSLTYYPLSTQTYGFTFFGTTGGKTGCSATVRVEPQPERPPVVGGGTATPTLEFKASPTTLRKGQSSYLSWKSTNATRCVLQSSDSRTEQDVATTGGLTVYPGELETQYRLICSSDPGTGKDGPAVEKTVTVIYQGVREYELTASALSAIQSSIDDITRQLKALLGK